MAEFSIGDAERLTGLAAHTLRYWEETIPFIRPRKDDRGRRVYSSRDVDLLLRLKSLVQDQKFTLEGAGERLLRELTGEESSGAENDADGAAAVGSAAPPPLEPPVAESRPADLRPAGLRLAEARKTAGELRETLLELYALARKRPPEPGPSPDALEQTASGDVQLGYADSGSRDRAREEENT